MPTRWTGAISSCAPHAENALTFPLGPQMPVASPGSVNVGPRPLLRHASDPAAILTSRWAACATTLNVNAGRCEGTVNFEQSCYDDGLSGGEPKAWPPAGRRSFPS